jgi:hypothetical protein
MNRQIAFAIAAALALAGSAYAQTQAAPEGAPGGVGSPTPGTVNPQATDPSTTTPGTVSPPAKSPDESSPSSASSPHQRSPTGQNDTPEASPSNGPDPNSPQQRSTTGMDRSRSASSDAGPTRTAAASNVSAGMPVQTVSGEQLGTVRDVVPNASGEPAYVVITKPKGGKTAVPYTTANAMMHDGSIVLDRARLEGAPQIQDSQLQNPSDKRWQKQAEQYWNGRGSMRSTQPQGRSGPAAPGQG